jgi:hypothetical protein
VSQVSGGSHNSLVVEMADHVVVFDASMARCNRASRSVRFTAATPTPIKYLVLSHHYISVSTAFLN